MNARPAAFFAILASLVSLSSAQTKPLPFENEIIAFEKADAANPPEKGGIVFTGSSSIRIWKSLKTDFPGLNVINRGFGGSQVSDSVRYASRTVIPYAPRLVVFYAGTNDIASGKSAEKVFSDYKAFVLEVHAALPNTRIAYISNSPVPSRWKKWDVMKRANSLIKDYSRDEPGLQYIDIVPLMLDANGQPRPELFQADMLHMNPKGYVIWAAAVRPYLTSN